MTFRFEYDFFGHRLLYRLVDLLNERENKLDEIVDSKIVLRDRFNLDDMNFIGAILENFYSSFNFTITLRDIFKLNFSYQDLMIAIIYGFDVRIVYFMRGIQILVPER